MKIEQKKNVLSVRQLRDFMLNVCMLIKKQIQLYKIEHLHNFKIFVITGIPHDENQKEIILSLRDWRCWKVGITGKAKKINTIILERQ